MSTKKLLFVLFILLYFPLIVSSQAPIEPKMQVKGIVSDSLTEETVPYATIKIAKKDNPSKVEKVVPTDENGKFQFSMNQAGEYLLTVEFIGKEPTIKPFILAAGKTLDLGNILMKDNTKVLNEVVVSAQRPLIKVDLDKITYSMEDDPESKTNNALDMLKKVPMITVDGEENIQLKGSSAYKIYINGKPSSMLASNPKDVLRSMPASTIKDIEVITDPGAKYDAEGVAGIINIITKKNTAMGGYTATVNSWVNSQGGYGVGGNLMLKSGKFGFTGNYTLYKYRNPEYETSLIRENFKDLQNKYLIQSGTGKNRGNGQFGNGELSYEIDSLNLINIGFGRYAGDGKQTSYTSNRMEDATFAPIKEFDQFTDGTYRYGSTELKADYQMASRTVKDRLLTISYRLALEPDDWSSDNRIAGILNMPDSRNNQYSDGDQKEHTVQIDYATPFAKIHNLEAGLKYITRLNESNSGYQFLNAAGSWVDEPSLKDEFKHRQDIYSAYGSYAVKFKKIGFKAGLRYEGTHMNVKYPLAKDEVSNEKNFKTNLSNLVPSVTMSYQVNQSQSLRLGYNMRISRPGIWQLNPFENRTDSLNSSVGNPNLKPVESHTIDLNYNFFNPKFNMNASLSYNFVDNSIERITELDGIVSRTTYANVGKSKRLGLYTNLSWMPTAKIRLTGNLSGSYIDVKSNDMEFKLSNSGFVGNAYSNMQYTLPKDYKANVYLGGGTPYFNIQGRGPSYNYYGLSFSKGFLSDKLNINISASNFFSNYQKFRNIINNPNFHTESFSIYQRRFFSMRVSYRFGEMKAQIKKAVRGITNDDSMGGGSGGNNSQGGGGGG